MFLIFVAFFISTLSSFPRIISSDQIQDDEYQVMIDEPNLKLKRDSNAVRRNAWRLLKKFEVIEKKCPISREFWKESGKFN